ncbi:hypothetical protein PG993_002689 [Apiospora rasikravindrae]|uniref:Uncharacterized protein n=1 Tax=Apiospora rasikravindrae TaxID=990691 RepID=A0ABR1U034_9PEZI
MAMREQRRGRDQSFWITHFRQRGYKRPGQQQQQLSGYPQGGADSSSRSHGRGNTNNARSPSPPGKELSSSPYLSPNHPRPFDHIESERQHLQCLLGEQDRRARDLFSRIAAVDEAYNFGSIHEHLQARKDRVWLQRRIDETVGWEKEILVRLGEIHVEIQCRKRWYMVEQQRAFLRQQGGQPQHDRGWSDGNGDRLDWSQSQRGFNAILSHRRHNLRPATVGSYTQQQQQHALSVSPYYPSMAAGTWTNAPEWYLHLTTPAGVDRRRRTSGDQDAGQVRFLVEKNPAYLSRRSSYLSNASYEAETGKRFGPSRSSVLPDSRLPDRRRSLPTMHYN